MIRSGCILFSSLLLYSALNAQPKLKPPGRDALNFGEIFTGSTITRTLFLKNEGTDTLKISNVTVSCGCTVALISSNNVSPNDSATLTVTFKSGAYLDNVTKSVIVDSNDPLMPRWYINFSVDIKSVLRMTPRFMYFGRVKVDSAYTKSIELRNETSAEVTILSSTPQDSQLTSVQIGQTTLKPGEKTTLTATLHPMQTGYIQGNIELKTDFRPYPMLSLGFNAQSTKLSPADEATRKKKE